jgi:uncharacterized protein YjeT (DUF2065 family)
MLMRRLIELGAILAIGEGLVAFVAPRRYSLLWRFGPESYKRLMTGLAERPALVRLFSTAEVGVGLWLALRQFPNVE